MRKAELARIKMKKEEEELSKRLETLMNSSTDQQLNPPQPHSLPEPLSYADRMAASLAEFSEFKRTSKDEAERFVVASVLLFFEESELADKRLLYTIESDVIIMSGLLYNIKASQYTVSMFRKDLESGTTTKDAVFGLNNLEKTLSEWYTKFGNFKTNLRTSYAQLSMEMHGGKEEPPTPPKPELEIVQPEVLVESNSTEPEVHEEEEVAVITGGMRTYGSKELLRTLKASSIKGNDEKI